jgi:hypothetical protein
MTKIEGCIVAIMSAVLGYVAWVSLAGVIMQCPSGSAPLHIRVPGDYLASWQCVAVK